MSQTYSAALIAVLVQVLPWIGVRIGSDELTLTITTIVTIVSAVWVMVRRIQQGDITILGSRKK